MKAIRIATLAIALCAGITSVAAAQGQPDQKQGRGAGMGGMLLKDITLTEAQKEQIKTIRENYVPKQLALRKAVQATGGPPDEATKAKMTELQNQQSAEIRAVLTADQQVIFDRNVVEMKAHMDARKKGGS
jgi:Spy/CpxP family protein refolding chaperone